MNEIWYRFQFEDLFSGPFSFSGAKVLSCLGLRVRTVICLDGVLWRHEGGCWGSTAPNACAHRIPLFFNSCLPSSLPCAWGLQVFASFALRNETPISGSADEEQQSCLHLHRHASKPCSLLPHCIFWMPPSPETLSWSEELVSSLCTGICLCRQVDLTFLTLLPVTTLPSSF